MNGGIVLFGAFILYPFLVFFLTKRYLEEKHKADNAIFNKSLLDFEDLMKRKYLINSMRSLQIGLLGVFIGIGNEIAAFFKYSEQVRLYSTVWQKDDWFVKSNIQNEIMNFTYASGLSIILVLGGLSLLIYSFISQKKLRNINNSKN